MNTLNRNALLPIYAITLLLIIYFCRSILTPFISGALIAYLSHPISDWISIKTKIRKSYTAAIVIIAITLILLLSITILLPIVYREFVALNVKFASIDISKYTAFFLTKIYKALPPYIQPHVEAALLAIPQQILALLQYMLTKIITSTTSIINLVLYIILSPIIAYHIIRDRIVIKHNLLLMLPTKAQHFANLCAKNIHEVLQLFFRGQCIIALIWITYYTISFTAIGINTALSLGILSGLSCLIPYIGAVFSSVVAATVVIAQFECIGVKFALVLSVYAFGHALDMIFVSNKFLGKKLGLHPLLTIFSLLFSASFFGIFGIFVAIPTTVLIKRGFIFILQQLMNNEEIAQ